MIVNFNVGLLGHVDSGKTTLARALSSISSTAAFDKNPQSQDRGITLDLGFSALHVDAPEHLKTSFKQLQITFVDCPGHASLIRTIIGGAQIIDLMVLVIDAQKGIQTQTAECIVLGEILQRQLIVVVNKIDLLEELQRDLHLAKLKTKLSKSLAKTAFGADTPIFCVSAQTGTNLQQLLNDGLCAHAYLPKRNTTAPLLMYVDHCFLIKGQGTVCTGTVVQGQVAVNDEIEIPLIREQRKVKSIQMFHRPMQRAEMGDRLGLCVTQFNAKLLERGLITKPGYLQPIYAACIRLEQIDYFKFAIRSKSKFHVSVGHDTVMASITLFQRAADLTFDFSQEYEYLETLPNTTSEKHKITVFVLLEFETAILAPPNATLIASKLDLDAHHSNCCRLAFWGQLQWLTHSNNYAREQLPMFKIFKRKQRQGTIQRLVNERQAIVQNLFKKESNRDVYIGKVVELSTGENGVIESTFGQTSKVKIVFPNGLKAETLDLLQNGRSSNVLVLLKFKKYIFNANMSLVQ